MFDFTDLGQPEFDITTPGFTWMWICRTWVHLDSDLHSWVQSGACSSEHEPTWVHSGVAIMTWLTTIMTPVNLEEIEDFTSKFIRRHFCDVSTKKNVFLPKRPWLCSTSELMTLLLHCSMLSRAPTCVPHLSPCHS